LVARITGATLPAFIENRPCGSRPVDPVVLATRADQDKLFDGFLAALAKAVMGAARANNAIPAGPVAPAGMAGD
jgi:hypothetical protein